MSKLYVKSIFFIEQVKMIDGDDSEKDKHDKED